jgi:hypothetical protein
MKSFFIGSGPTLRSFEPLTTYGKPRPRNKEDALKIPRIHIDAIQELQPQNLASLNPRYNELT